MDEVVGQSANPHCGWRRQHGCRQVHRGTLIDKNEEDGRADGQMDDGQAGGSRSQDPPGFTAELVMVLLDSRHVTQSQCRVLNEPGSDAPSPQGATD
ncbi:hypothetical protein INR49_020813 [Caranx melampygus]|nr:hypothetical protein INR49_020813 [Caranx melampygus]